MMSLNARLLLTASIVLVAFLSFTGYALDRAFSDSGLVAVKERLQTEMYSLLAAADSDDISTLIMPDTHPDLRLSTPASGIYAEVISDKGKLIWRSGSMLGITIPFNKVTAKGEAVFGEVISDEGTELYTLELGIVWEVAPFIVKGYSFHVAETKERFEKQRSQFRKSLIMWLGAAVVALLLVQAMILRWGLAPLRKVASEVAEIESGHREELSADYPREIELLANNLNVLLRSSNSHLKRYRNALGDLAHSLKTPLAVLRNLVESDELPIESKKTISEQLERLDNTVEYQLQRAVAQGRKALAAPINIKNVVQKLLSTFNKVYVDKQINFQLNIDPRIKFIGDEGDLMELLGNLMDNACKWCQTTVRVSSFGKDNLLTILIEDDGKGIAEDEREAILKRGIRGDSQVEGHGIGMAVVRNLVEEVYEGTLMIGKSDLGGAKISITMNK
ncbi:MAG: ATP-binding protein [Gammaproteobacteria bacterium]